MIAQLTTMHDLEPQRREMCWRVIEGPSGRLVVCAIYETASAICELRVSYAADQALRTESLANAESARIRAQQWLRTFRAAGFVGSINES
jgi:hypothetical protein